MRLIKATKSFDELGNEAGLIIHYRVGGDERTVFLAAAEIDGLTPAQIKVLAQTRASEDTGLPGPGNEREDVLPNPTKEAREWLKNNPVIMNTFEKPPPEIFTTVNAMTNAQAREALAHAIILIRTLVLERIAG